MALHREPFDVGKHLILFGAQSHFVPFIFPTFRIQSQFNCPPIHNFSVLYKLTRPLKSTVVFVLFLGILEGSICFKVSMRVCISTFYTHKT